MNQEDNIHEFFKNKLKDTKPADDAWNIPSDVLWHKAKKEFPKKKKRRPFIFFIFGILAVGIASIFYFSLSTKSNFETNQIIPVVENKLETINSENAIVSNSVEQTEHAKVEPMTAISNTNKNPENVSLKRTPETSSSIPTKSNILKEKRSKKNSTVSSSTLAESGNNNLISRNNNQKSGLVIHNSKEQLVVATKPKAKTNAVENSAERMDLDLKKLSVDISSLTKKEIDDGPGYLNKFKTKRGLNRWELGISYAPFILDFESLAETEESGENEMIKLNLNYWNLNLPVTRRLNRKFSLSSGIYLSNVDIDLNFTTEVLYDVAETDNELKALLKKKAVAGSLTLNEASSDVGIEFLPNVNLMNGDTVLVEGALPVTVSAIQFPLLLNYHFGNGRLEGLLHAGVSFDFFRSNIDNIAFKVYKDDVLITKPVQFKPLTDEAFDIGLYIGTGMRYHINERFNLGISAKFDAGRLLLSRFELGAYYGF